MASCIDKEKKVEAINTPFILGDWFALYGNNYTEFYFDEHKMSTHGLSGNIYAYDYHLFNGKKLKLVDSSGNTLSRYFDDIIKVDSFAIVFKNITLHRLNDNHTLGSYLDNKIVYDSLRFHFLQRNANAIPIDSLLKMAGEPIDIDKLYEEVQ